MAKYKLLLPKMGESVAEATVIKWTKKPGDHVETDETVMEIATDKVDSDVPSPVTGKLLEQLCQENDVVQVGAVIAIIETGEAEEVKAPPVQAAAPVTPPQPVTQHFAPTFHIEETPAPKVEETPPPAPTPQFHRPVEPAFKAPEPVYQPPVEPVYKAPETVHQPPVEPVYKAPEAVHQPPVEPEEVKPPVFSEQREDLTPPVPYIEQTERKEPPAEGKNELRFYSPLVKNIAAQEGISNDELDKIPGTGAEGRLTKDDLLNYIQNRFTITSPTISTVVPEEHVKEVEEMKTWPEAHSIEAAATESHEAKFEEAHSPDIEPVAATDAEPDIETPEPVAEQTTPAPQVEEPYEEPVAEASIAETIAPDPVAEIPQPEPVAEAPKAEPVVPPAVKSSASMSGGDEIIEMDRMRRLIADHMVMSKQTSPHVTSFVEADVTNLVLWREKIKGSFEKREGEKITFTPLFIEAVTRAIKDMPMINIQLNGTQIIKKKDINIGMATALPSGNLIVPVIKRADELSLIGLTKAVNDLANRARSNKLKPDDIQGGTFTITNVGTFGNVMGTPIINQPQVAILAVGAIRKKPAVIETLQGDMIGIRHMMFLSLSYDHRVVDGALGGSFVRRIADYLENWDPGREF